MKVKTRCRCRQKGQFVQKAAKKIVPPVVAFYLENPKETHNWTRTHRRTHTHAHTHIANHSTFLT